MDINVIVLALILPQPCEGPSTELAANRRPLAELFGQVPPRRAGPDDPENPIQNKTMIGWFAPVRMPNGMDEPLEEGPLVVGYQIARQEHLPRRDDLESQTAERWNPFCQHDLAAKCCPHICHRNIDAGRIGGIAQMPKPEIFVEVPTPVETLVLKHVQDDGGGPHLTRDSKAALHRVNNKCSAKTLSLH